MKNKLKDITIVPLDYIAIHTKTDTIIYLDKDNNCKYDINIQFMPLIKCKNCNAYDTTGYVDGVGFCLYHQSVMDENGYCSCAERRDDE